MEEDKYLLKSAMRLIEQFLSPYIFSTESETPRYLYYVSITRHVTNNRKRPLDFRLAHTLRDFRF